MRLRLVETPLERALRENREKSHRRNFERHTRNELVIARLRSQEAPQGRAS